MGFSNERWRCRSLRSATEGAEGDRHRGRDLRESVLVEIERSLDAAEAATGACAERVVERAEADLDERSGRVEGPDEIALHPDRAVATPAHAVGQALEADLVADDAPAAEHATVDGEHPAARHHLADHDLAGRVAVHAGEADHGHVLDVAILVAVVADVAAEGDGAVGGGHGRRGDAVVAPDDQVLEAGADHEVVLRRGGEA